MSRIGNKKKYSMAEPAGESQNLSRRSVHSYLRLDLVGKRLGETLHRSVKQAKQSSAEPKKRVKSRRGSVVVGDMVRKLKDNAKVKISRTLGGDDGRTTMGRRRRNHFELAIILRGSPENQSIEKVKESEHKEKHVVSATISMLWLWVVALLCSRCRISDEKRRVHAEEEGEEEDQEKEKENQEKEDAGDGDNTNATSSRDHIAHFTRDQVAVIASLKGKGLEVQAVPFSLGE
jgi:hypothetical protein